MVTGRCLRGMYNCDNIEYRKNNNILYAIIK